MALEIQGNREKGGVTALDFSDRGRARVDALSNLTSAHVSRDDGLTFNLISHDATAAAGTHICYLKNTSTTRDLYIDLLRVGNAETALWKVWSVTGTAAGGSALTPTNLDLKRGISAEVTARGNDAITGLTQVSEIATVRCPSNDSRDIPLDDTLILGTDNAIAVEIDTDDGTPSIAEVLIRFYFLNK